MQKNRICFLAVCFMSVAALFLWGCEFSKEVVLEHEAQIMSDNPSEETESVNVGEEQIFSDEDETGDVEVVQIYIYVCGQVNNPGVYIADSDARVYQAIDLAGGVTDEADVSAINQAQRLHDGQMIYVPKEGETVTSLKNGTFQAGESSFNEMININTAGLEDLMSLPGIGEGKAQKILEYRQENGSFHTTEEIMNVEGIKEGTYTKFKDKITV